MKSFLIILVFFFNIQTLSKADDIRDFELEGISIGDTILRYMNASKIESKKVDYYKDLTFSSINIYSDDEIVNFEIYDQIVLGFKTDDKNYSIVAISGILIIDFDNCMNKIDLVTKDVSNILPNTNQISENVKATLGDHIYNKFELSNGDNIKVSCVKYHDENDYPDHLRIAVNKDDYQEWLNTKAYK